MITLENLSKMIDHTNLRADVKNEDLKRLCSEAKENGFAMVAINSYPVRTCAGELRGSGVHVGAAIGFPLGQTTIETKLYETKSAIAAGADEIDYVINVNRVKEKDFDYIENEMKQIVAECRKSDVICKVIFENCYLTSREIAAVAEIAKKIKPDFIKTSTGFGTYGARVEDVKLMKSVVGNSVKVKAAGGIRDLKTALEMIDAGAERIGTSSGIKIVNEYRAMFL